MYALIMVSAAALASAQPVAATADGLVGPVFELRPVAGHAIVDENPEGDARIGHLALDLPYMAQGAQLRLQILRLKLRVPI